MKRLASNMRSGPGKSTRDYDVDPGKVAILFGAGVSLRGPANLPLANDLLRVIHDKLPARAGKGSVVWRQDEMPQFEVIMDCLRRANTSVVGRLLKVFQKVRPNPNHHLLARLGRAGCWLVTTNFDTNVEAAIQNLGSRARSLIDVRDAGRFDERGVLVPLLKLHGCISSPQSIVATMSGLGRRGSVRLPHFLSVGRQKALRQFLRGRVCLVFGYSGSDKLDVLPALQCIKDCRILLLQHDGNCHVNFEAFRARILTSPGSRAGKRKQWFDDTLSGDTTEFLGHLSRLCGLALRPPKSFPTKDPDMTDLNEAIDSLSADQAGKALSLMRGVRSAGGKQEEKVRQYIARLRKGMKPVVLAGGSVLFSARNFGPGKKPSPGDVWQLGSLSPETRARLCYEVGKALADSSGKGRGAARSMLGQAANLWSKLGHSREQHRAQTLLDRLATRPSNRNRR